MLNSFEIKRPTVQQESHYKKRSVKRSSKQSTRKERMRLSNELERHKLETYTQPQLSSQLRTCGRVCNCGCYEREQMLVDVIEFYQRIATFVVVGIVAKIVIDALSERK